MNQQFDPVTGQPLNSSELRFDPMTGQPINLAEQRLDPMTGQPIESQTNNQFINSDVQNIQNNTSQENQNHIPLRKKTMQVEPQPYVENPFKNIATVGQSSDQFLENAQRDFKQEEEKEKSNNLSLGTFIFIFVLMMLFILVLFPILVKIL